MRQGDLMEVDIGKRVVAKLMLGMGFRQGSHGKRV